VSEIVQENLAEAAPALGDRLADKYRLERVLGEGGTSVVYAAVNTLTGKHVAIKWLRPEAAGDDAYAQRLLREARATSAIDHPNVVNLYDVDRHGSAIFLVMELLHGEPLSAALRAGRLAPGTLVRLLLPVLRGVQAAHRVGLVHRDLKPDNVFLCRDPYGAAREPKVLDFGIAKPIGGLLEQSDEAEAKDEGLVFGTPHYMAPEQLRDVHVADPRSDIYALGVIMYRALAFEYPYDGDSLRELARCIVTGGATPLHALCPQVDERLCEVVMRAIALDPAERPQSAAELAAELEPFAHHGAGTVTRDSTAPAHPPAHDDSVSPSLALVPAPTTAQTTHEPQRSVTVEGAPVLALSIAPPPKPARSRGAARGVAAVLALGLVSAGGWQLAGWPAASLPGRDGHGPASASAARASVGGSVAATRPGATAMRAPRDSESPAASSWAVVAPESSREEPAHEGAPRDAAVPQATASEAAVPVAAPTPAPERRRPARSRQRTLAVARGEASSAHHDTPRVRVREVSEPKLLEANPYLRH
jgi:eukaryotic-like serine/threonine-protein kinase